MPWLAGKKGCPRAWAAGDAGGHWCPGGASCIQGVNEMPETPRGIWPGSLVSAAGEEQAVGNTETQPPPALPLQPSRNALIGLMKAKHTTCNIYKWLIRQRNRSAGLKTLGT